MKPLLLTGMKCAECGCFMLGSLKDRGSANKICSECGAKRRRNVAEETNGC